MKILESTVSCLCGRNDWYIEYHPTPKIRCHCGSILKFLD